MADKTGIEWTDATWNPIVGCSVVSPGCTNCYAMKMAGRIEAMAKGRREATHYAGTTRPSKAGSVWTGQLALAPEQILLQPLSWKTPRRIFVNSMGDLFHEDMTDHREWLDLIFAVMAMAPQHTFQILTKRPHIMREYLFKCLNTRGAIARNCIDLVLEKKISAARMGEPSWPVESVGDEEDPDDIRLKHWPLPNVWLGVSVEDQRRADERIPPLLDTPATVRFLSCEPLLGPIDLNNIHREPNDKDKGMPGFKDCTKFSFNSLHGSTSVTCDGKTWYSEENETRRLDWIIAGGESGPCARPMHPDWARSLRDQCVAANVPFFFKQWGEWSPFDFDGTERRGDWMILDKGGDLDIPDDRTPDEDAGECAVVRRGKSNSGRTLDGRTWDEIPGRPE